MQIREHQLEVRRTARYCALGGGSGDGPRSVWYVLHGYRQLAHRFISRFEEIAQPARLIVAPEALNRFYLDDDEGGTRRHGADSPVGATWMTRHDREAEIADYLGYLDALDRAIAAPADARRVVLGFSQGAATAARWAVLGAARLDRLVLWGSGLPHDLDVDAHATRLRALRPVLVVGERDRALTAEAAEAERVRLERAGVEASIQVHPAHHEVVRDALKRLAASIDPE